MNVESTKQPPHQNAVDAIVIGVRPETPLSGAAREVDLATSGLISRLIEHEEIDTECRAITTILGPPGVVARQVVVVGLGTAPLDSDTSLHYQLAGLAAKHLAAKPP